MSGDMLCYRSVAVEIAPGRFSRDHWRMEVFRVPDRGPPEQKARPKAQRPGATPVKWQKTCNPNIRTKLVQSEVAPSNGAYTIVSFDNEHPSFRPILAACTGPTCGGHHRRFSHAEWKRNIRACNKCSCHQRSLEHHAGKVVRDAAE
jgi:hypothetical protein